MMKFIKAVDVLFMILLLLQPLFGEHHNRQRGNEEYLDPTDMLNFDPVNMRMRNKDTPEAIPSEAGEKPDDETPLDPTTPNTSQSPTHTSSKPPDQNCIDLKNDLDATQVLMQQYVMTLVSAVESKVGTVTHPVELNLRLRLSYHDLSKLRHYGQGYESKIHDAHEILTRMVMYASDVLEPETIVHRLEAWMGLSSHMLIQIIIVIWSILALLILLPRMVITRRFLLQGLFFTLVISVGFTWLEMYQKEVADQEVLLMKKMSDHCPRVEDMSLWSRVTSYISSTFTFKEDKCRSYYQAMLVSPMVKVSPIEALSVAIVKTFVTPLGTIGNGIKAFIVGLFQDLPVQYQMYLMIAFAFMLVVTPFLMSGYYINFFHLLHIGPTPVVQQIAPPPQQQQIAQPPTQEQQMITQQSQRQQIAPPSPQARPLQRQLPAPLNEPIRAQEHHAPQSPKPQDLISQDKQEDDETPGAALSSSYPHQGNTSDTTVRHRHSRQLMTAGQETDSPHPTSTTQKDGTTDYNYDLSASGDGMEISESNGVVQDTVVTSSVGSDPLGGGDGSVAISIEKLKLDSPKEDKSECEDVCDKLRDVKITSGDNSSSCDESQRLVTSKMEEMKISSQDCQDNAKAEFTEKSKGGSDEEKKHLTEPVSDTSEHQADADWTVVSQSDIQS